jgi:hypothetical protein
MCTSLMWKDLSATDEKWRKGQPARHSNSTAEDAFAIGGFAFFVSFASFSELQTKAALRCPVGSIREPAYREQPNSQCNDRRNRGADESARQACR